MSGVCEECGGLYDTSMPGGVMGVFCAIASISGTKGFLYSSDRCAECNKRRVAIILAIVTVVIGIIIGLFWKLPKYIYSKAGKKGVIIYFAVLAGLCVSGLTVYELKAAAREQAQAQERAEWTAGIEEKAESESVPEKVLVESGTFTDSRDGKKYKTTKIGKQTWLAENLNYNANGSKCYEDKSANCDKYGRLYSWQAAKTACPSGWHLPSYDEWSVLSSYAGKASKLKAKSGWAESGSGTDDFSFAALPGGQHDSEDGFIDIGRDGVWWNANSGTKNVKFMHHNQDEIWEGDSSNDADLASVRCMQD